MMGPLAGVAGKMYIKSSTEVRVLYNCKREKPGPQLGLANDSGIASAQG